MNKDFKMKLVISGLFHSNMVEGKCEFSKKKLFHFELKNKNNLYRPKQVLLSLYYL